MSLWTVVVAAGSGQRFGGEVPKQYQLLSGRPMLSWTLEAFQHCPVVDGVVVVVAAEQRERASALVTCFDFDKVRHIEDGAEDRADSVRRGLRTLPAGCGLVAIHDGARPLVTVELIERVAAAAARDGAAIPTVAVRDTVKRVRGQMVDVTENRSQLRLAQTPQIFRRDLIQRAYEAPTSRPPTDDAQLVEQLGEPVILVEGDPANLKITDPEDLRTAEILLDARRGFGRSRVGLGFDVHRLVLGRPLILGGVTIPHPLGLLGHSDADVLVHAVGDAMLGAASLGDLGSHFPPEDPELRGTSSLVLLEQVRQLVDAAGYHVGNVDATLVCQKPRLAPHIEAMRRKLATALAVDSSRVSVKATTTEGLGFSGRGDGIAAHSVVMLVGRGERP